ncbi:hypothetical protein KIPB_006352 [Kipferlia bialata]|uniref:Uncharacterized protein n=1 Tax=Kipferlia bialata TaxID=797122 RepID=A0A9K3GJS2_9EUKA|nr:hypothetical protein KIPB_006352 [Kipferlia bialata]|eukprot:g6352.t1
MPSPQELLNDYAICEQDIVVMEGYVIVTDKSCCEMHMLDLETGAFTKIWELEEGQDANSASMVTMGGKLIKIEDLCWREPGATECTIKIRMDSFDPTCPADGWTSIPLPDDAPKYQRRARVVGDTLCMMGVTDPRGREFAIYTYTMEAGWGRIFAAPDFIFSMDSVGSHLLAFTDYKGERPEGETGEDMDLFAYDLSADEASSGWVWWGRLPGFRVTYNTTYLGENRFYVVAENCLQPAEKGEVFSRFYLAVKPPQ